MKEKYLETQCQWKEVGSSSLEHNTNVDANVKLQADEGGRRRIDDKMQTTSKQLISQNSLLETEPYLRGVVLPMQDEIPNDSNSVDASIEDLKLALADLHCLEIKLKTLKDEQLQTPLWNSFRWAEKEDFLDYNKAFVPSLAERISFAALQPVVGATVSEIQGLLQARLDAMVSTSTVQRLENVIKLVKESKALIAAKLAIQSLEL